MYKIPLTNSPNQSFEVTVPVNGSNENLRVFISYNEAAKYWQMTLYDADEQKELFSCLPLLFSFYDFANIAKQINYKKFGSIYIAPIQPTLQSMPDDLNLGTNYVMIWGDNEQ